MSAILGVHIAAGIIAIFTGGLAIAVRKGGSVRVIAGSWFFGSMLLLGLTAAALAQAKDDASLGLGGLLTCYFVATSWVAARRRDGITGRFEIIACAAALGTGALMIWMGIATVAPPTPVGTGPLFALGGLCIVAGLLDLNVILGGKLTPVQRLSRHLWRMCFAFFIATGSFFLGQQDVMPAAVRGSSLLFVLAFAPFAAMAYWLVRMRFAKSLARLKVRSRPLVLGATSAPAMK